MKSLIFYFKTLPVIVCLLMLSATGATAQNANTVTSKKPATPHCDEILPTVKKQAQQEANQNCKTVTVCTECIEKASKLKIDAVQVIQPTCDGAAQMEDLVVESKVAYKTMRLNVQILQSPCINKGMNLEAFVPGANQNPNRSQYAFLWEIDGKKAGHEKTINCTCGKVAVVRVTDTNSGISISRTARLKGCQDTSKD